MAPNPTIMQAVEQLDYRVTIGDVAAKAGLDVKIAERELLALASDAGGHLQVADTGDLVYLFPKDFRAILRNKFWKLQLQEWWEKIWRVLFYLIRISFGIVLIVSIILIFAAIFIIVTASNRDNESGGGRSRSGGGGMIFMPNFWYWGDLFWFFDPDYRRSHQRRQERRDRREAEKEPGMNFLEAVFSFLFGDGNPNADLEEKRFSAIATVIRNNGGAVTGEQIAPYLDQAIDDYEEYMLPVLTRFNGLPQVSPDGEIVYHFPELQITATKTHRQSVPAYLEEIPWQFSQASSAQKILSAGLGGLNLVGALMLGSLLQDDEIAEVVKELGGLVALVDSIYWLLLAYGAAFLIIPLVRYFWIQWRNGKILANNQQRQERAIALEQADDQLQKKLAYASQFAAQNVISTADLAYTTETDLIEQEFQRSAQLDAEWQRKLDGN